MKAGWGSKTQQSAIQGAKNSLDHLVRVGRMAPVPLTNLAATSALKTRGAQVGFKVTSIEGIDHFVLLRNFSRDPGSAQAIHVWPVASLKNTPQGFPLNLQHTDADPVISGQKAYYWVKAVPASDRTSSNAFLSGPQVFDASNLPVAQTFTGDLAISQAYTPTTQPLSASTGGSANHATISIASFQIQYPFDANGDGLPDLISYSSGSITPLNDNTTYYVYFDDPKYVGGPQTYIAQTNVASVVSGLHRQYLGSITTPALGGGGTFGGGGGGGPCFSGNTWVVTRRGRIPISVVQEGDYVLSAMQRWREVAEVLVHDYDGPMHVMPCDGLVTPEHRVRPLGAPEGWVPAKELFPLGIQRFIGKVFNLHLKKAKKSTNDDLYSYQLANGWFAHNLRK